VSLILLTLAEAMADGTAIWLSTPPDPSLDPDATHLRAESLLPGPAWTAEDARAIENLSAELAEVRPMLDVFDGELQIMLRLEQALSSIRAVRPEDRDLIYQALLFQGLAVSRYFQDGLATEAGAEQYRAIISREVEVRPWIDAVAFAPKRQPGLAEIPEEPELLKFQEARARHLLRPTTTLSVDLPDGARLLVDGQEAVGDAVQALPGRHWMALTIDGTMVAHAQFRTDQTGSTTFQRPVLSTDLEALAAAMAAGSPSIELSDATVSALSSLQAPVLLHTGEGRRRLTYTVTGSRASIWVEDSAPATGLGWRVSAGTGWLYDGDFYLQNAASGAPGEVSTVNAIAPLLSAGVEWRLGVPVLAAGIDALLPTGEWHDLPTGDTRIRIRPYPHLAAGIRSLQVTAGLMLPWHVGVGPRAHLTLSEPLGLSLTGAYVYGRPVTLSREDGSTFTPNTSQTAWLSVGISR
jgi:hypothetical protein